MSRYGDTPAGMVESAMEFLRVCVANRFMDVVISIKASNTTVMVETVRRLVRAMDAEDMHFPLHLGVTEAGDGEDGRIKSAVGIGTLLAEGTGDTIRVSLSEDPACEVPVAETLLRHITSRQGAPVIDGEVIDGYDFMAPARIPSHAVNIVGRQCRTGSRGRQRRHRRRLHGQGQHPCRSRRQHNLRGDRRSRSLHPACRPPQGVA